MCAFVSAHSHACLYMRGACSHALTEDVFIKLHMLSMGSGSCAARRVCVSGWRPVHSPAGYCWTALATSQQPSVSLRDCFRGTKFVQPLSLYILVRAALISSACHTGYCSDSGAIPNEQLDTEEGMFCWPKQLLVSINSAVKTNGGQPKAWMFSLDPWGSLYVHTWFNWSTCVWHIIYTHSTYSSIQKFGVSMFFLYLLYLARTH